MTCRRYCGIAMGLAALSATWACRDSPTESAIVGIYNGTDLCEASFDGSLSMVRKP